MQIHEGMFLLEILAQREKSTVVKKLSFYHCDSDSNLASGVMY